MLSKKSSSEAMDAAVAEATVSRRVHPFFNRTLFFKNVTRFWPLWLCYTVIWAFALPVQIFVEMAQARRYGWPNTDFSYLADQTILNLTSDMGVFLSLAFGLMAAIAVFSYLFSARSTGLMHTLPIRREGLFLTNYLSGLAFLFVPNLFIALLTFALESAAGILNAWNIVLWLLIQCGTCFFFYTFAVLCGMFTGHIIAMPALYGIFNCLAMVISALLDGVMDLFIFGYEGLSWGDTLTEWLTPFAKLINSLHFRSVTENGVDVILFTGYQYVLAYCGVAVIFLICALYLYEARHMESAGDVIAVGWAKPVFKFGLAFCAALCGGFMLYYTFRSLFEDTKVIFILFCLLSGVIGCFAAEMLLQKSFKVFKKKTWLSCGLFSACLVLVMAGVTNDVMGLETKVPDPDRVTTVQLNGSSLAPYDSANSSFYSSDPETIQAVVAMHQGIVNDRAFYKAFDSGDYYSRSWEDGSEPTWDYNWLNFNYTLMDGSTLSRSYHIPFNVSSETPDPDSVEGIYLALTNAVENLLEAYFPDEELNARPSGGYLSVYNTVKNSYEEVTFTAEQAGILVDAAREDVLAGRLGIHYLNDSCEERRANCSVQDLQLEWNYTSQNRDPGSAVASREMTTIAINANSVSRVWTCQITPQFTATSLMTALHDLGILDDTHVLLSHADLDHLEDPAKYPDTEVSYSYLD